MKNSERKTERRRRRRLQGISGAREDVMLFRLQMFWVRRKMVRRRKKSGGWVKRQIAK